MALNDLGGELLTRRRPVTLARVNLPDIDLEAEAREAAERAAEVRTMRAGRDAWQLIGKAESFESWRAIGSALLIGKQHALKVSGANAPWGRNYTHAFNRWAKQFGFVGMAASVRSVAVELAEYLPAIEQWRETLTGTATQAAHSSFEQCAPLASLTGERLRSLLSRFQAGWRSGMEARCSVLVAMSATDAAKLRNKIRNEVVSTCETPSAVAA